MLGALPYTVVAANEDLAWQAGLTRAVTADVRLSLGDRFRLALARRLGLPAYTADSAWREVAATIAVKLVAIR